MSKINLAMGFAITLALLNVLFDLINGDNGVDTVLFSYQPNNLKTYEAEDYDFWNCYNNGIKNLNASLNLEQKLNGVLKVRDKCLPSLERGLKLAVQNESAYVYLQETYKQYQHGLEILNVELVLAEPSVFVNMHKHGLSVSTYSDYISLITHYALLNEIFAKPSGGVVIAEPYMNGEELKAMFLQSLNSQTNKVYQSI